MNPIIREQLLKTKAVSFYTEDNKQILKAELQNQTKLIVKQKNFSDPTEDLMLFTFKDYLIHPFEGFDFHEKFNKGRCIPLSVMQGRIIRTVGKMYYIKVKGFYMETNKCFHCLKQGNYKSVCSDCFKQLNVLDIEDITWEGYVPIKSIEEMVNI